MPRGPAPPSGADLKELINFAEVDSLLGIQFVNVTDVSIHQVETKTHYLEQEGDRAQKPITTTGKALKKNKTKKGGLYTHTRMSCRDTCPKTHRSSIQERRHKSNFK